MKSIHYLFLTIIFLFISCAQVEDFVETIMMENSSDSTQVEGSKDSTLEKPAEYEDAIEDWEMHGQAEIDKEKSSDDREGSIKLSKTANNWAQTDKVISKYRIPVTPGKTYELKYKIYTESWPPPTIHVSGEFHNNRRKLSNSEGSYFSSSNVRNWENNSLFIKVPNDEDIKYIIPKLSMLPKYGRNNEVWIDEFNVSEVEQSPKLPLENKKGFVGSLTRIDRLGNIEIFRNNNWQPFFLFGIYTDKKRSDWTTYSKQGFNTNMWASTSSAISRGIDAGLYSNIQIGQYIIDVDWLPSDRYEKINILESTIKKIFSNDLMKNVIFYYIDNEFYDITPQLIDVCNLVKELDTDNIGDRMHPIYMLNGAYGQARKYNDFVDITGTYVAQDRTDIPTPENFTGLQINENQNIPAVMAQINRGVGLNFRPVLFGAIAKGAKGMGFWRDGGSGIDITGEPWWNDFPVMVDEINQMMPLIKEPHFTDWNAVCDRDELIFGTRMFKNKGHLIIANPTNSSINASFTITDLPYKIASVNNYFNNNRIGQVDENSFTITVNAHGSEVIRLD